MKKGIVIFFVVLFVIPLQSGYVVHLNKKIQVHKKDNSSLAEKQTSAKKNSHNRELVKKGKYCYIVIPISGKNRYVWSFLRASYFSQGPYNYIKSSIYDNRKITKIYFENGQILEITEKGVIYNKKTYNIDNNLNIFIDNDRVILGKFISLFK